MAKRRSDQTSVTTNGAKPLSFEKEESERPQKRIKALLEEDDTSSEDGGSPNDAGGVPVDDGKPSVNGHGLTINEEYARRFEHNKKREELQKCE